METEINSKNKAKIKILFIVTQSEMGGAQRFLLTLISKLDPNRYEPVLAVGFQGDESFSNEVRDRGFRVIKLNNLARDINPIKDILAIFQIRDLILKENPDILFLNSSKAGFIGSLSALLTANPLKVIYRIGGWSFRDPGPIWKSWLWKALEIISSRWKDYVIVNSQEDFNLGRSTGIKPREDLLLIHNGIDVYKMGFLSKSDARDRLKLNQSIIIGTVANYYPAKGLEYLVEAATYLKHRPDIRFVIIGDGPERKRIENRIDILNLKDKFTLTGRIKDASNLITSFDIFILPSVKEGFPWAVIEAMASKVPVIATNVGAVSEVLDNGKNGLLIEPRNPKKIVESILYLLDNERVSNEMTILAHQTVLFKFNQDRMISSFENLFLKSLNINE